MLIFLKDNYMQKVRESPLKHINSTYFTERKKFYNFSDKVEFQYKNGLCFQNKSFDLVNTNF